MQTHTTRVVASCCAVCAALVASCALATPLSVWGNYSVEADVGFKGAAGFQGEVPIEHTIMGGLMRRPRPEAEEMLMLSLPEPMEDLMAEELLNADLVLPDIPVDEEYSDIDEEMEVVKIPADFEDSEIPEDVEIVEIDEEVESADSAVDADGFDSAAAAAGLRELAHGGGVCCADCREGDLDCYATCERVDCRPIDQCKQAGQGAYAAFCQKKCAKGLRTFASFAPVRACRGICAATVQHLCATDACMSHGCLAMDCLAKAPKNCG